MMRYMMLLSALLWSLTAQADPPALQLARVYESGLPLQGYWVSEKLDGVRGYWDGQRLWSRGGQRIVAPKDFTQGFPAVPLDGELWMGRGRFAEVSAAVRRLQPQPAEWQRIRFMVFDLPGSSLPFSQRLEQLQALIEASNLPHLQLIKQTPASTQQALQARLAQVESWGGEGLMLHHGDSFYQAGRSDELLKVKSYQDAEARVLAHTPGKGKYQGMLGALLVETSAGKRFRLGSGFSDEERRQPPPIGSWVTYKYYGETVNGLPRFASFLRIRDDAGEEAAGGRNGGKQFNTGDGAIVTGATDGQR